MKIYLILACISMAMLLLCGCATRTVRTTTTETITSESASASSGAEWNRGNLPQGNLEAKGAGQPRGIFGTTVHFVGQVLAFPFRLIAGVIEFIF